MRNLFKGMFYIILMEHSQTKYSNGVIYKITSPNTDVVYIGSSINVNKRRSQHKTLQTYADEGKPHKNVRSLEITCLDDWKLEVIETYPCQTKKELETRERYWIENTPNCINHHIPTRTTSEYRIANEDQKAKARQRTSKYYNEHREECKARFAEKIACNLCGGQVSRIHMSRHQKTKKCLEAAMLVGL